MFDIGFWELLVIGVMALLVLGPARLPGAIRSTLSTVRSVKKAASGFKNEMEEQLRIHELHENLRKAEEQGMQNLDPELQKSVDELTEAARSVQTPYKKSSK
jgi:sec-independent protein translocase protein TatB